MEVLIYFFQLTQSSEIEIPNAQSEIGIEMASNMNL